MKHEHVSFLGVCALIVATLTLGVVVPGVLGAISPVPVSLENAIGVGSLLAAFVLPAAAIYGLRQYHQPPE